MSNGSSWALCALACVASPLASQAPPKPDPKAGEILMQRNGDWSSYLVYQGDAGIWTVKSLKFLPQYGCAEVIGLDDKGRVLVLVSYSGKWTPHQTVHDGSWLGGIAHADLDPRVPGLELYTGGHSGSLYRTTSRPLMHGAFGLDSIEIGHFSADEIHTLAAGDLLPARPGQELLAFTASGLVHEVKPLPAASDPTGTGFSTSRIATLPGRVRDAVVLPAPAGEAPWIATVSRSGELMLVRLKEGGLDVEVVTREDNGMGRVAMRPGPGRTMVLYATRDDGPILRFERGAAGGWKREMIYAGPPGPRGIAAGRFHEDPARETIAIFGYSCRVELLSRRPGTTWEVETIHTDADQGHWLERAELDGRNATDEILVSGFGSRIVLLSRKPGYGIGDIAAAPVAAPPAQAAAAPAATAAGAATGGAESRPAAPTSAASRPVRVAVKASDIAVTQLSPLHYQGGFETKSLVYETLVRRDATGAIVPGLASAWSIEDEGRSVVFTLRPGATFHDGTPVTAEAVRIHFRRWVGLPEHGWLRSNERIADVQALGDSKVKVLLDRPHALLPDLCATNPCAIRGPGALDREGNHVRAVGSGPFRFAETREDGRVLRYARHGPNTRHGPPLVDLVRIDAEGAGDPIDALLRGDVDVVLSSWLVRVEPERARALRDDGRFRVIDGPGSSMVFLSFAPQGPCADPRVRRKIAAAIDRADLVAAVEHGFADPSTGWAAPSVKIWPQGRPPADGGETITLERPLTIAPGRSGHVSPALAERIAAQLTKAGLPARVESSGTRGGGTGTRPAAGERGGGADLRIEITHGVPYDPWTTLVSRFGPRLRQRTAETPGAPSSQDAALAALVEKALGTTAEDARAKIHAEIQTHLDRETPIVPLYAPRRIGIVRTGIEPPVLTHDMYGMDLAFLGER